MNTEELRKLLLIAINERYELMKALEEILKWSAHFPPALNEELKIAKNLLDKFKIKIE